MLKTGRRETIEKGYVERDIRADRDRANGEVSRLDSCLSDALKNQERVQNERELQSQRVVALEEEVAEAENHQVL